LDWLSLSPASGSNNATVTATCLPNTSTTSRTGTIVISGTAQTVTINQSGATQTLVVAPSQLNFSEIADNKPIAITSNTTWLATDDAAWLSITPSSGNGNGTLSVSVTANTGASERRAQITVRNTSGSLLQNISVIQAAKPFNAELPESWEVTITENNHTLILPSACKPTLKAATCKLAITLVFFIPGMVNQYVPVKGNGMAQIPLSLFMAMMHLLRLKMDSAPARYSL